MWQYLLSSQQSKLSEKKVASFLRISNTNKITKVYLVKMIDIVREVDNSYQTFSSNELFTNQCY